MPKSTFGDFISENPNCKKFDGNPDAMNIFEILNQDNSIINMTEAISAGKPALTPCVKAIEDYVDSQTNPSISLDDNFTRQAIGVMAKTVLVPFGYRVCERRTSQQKDLPKATNAKYFKSASCYELTDSATMRIVKHIEEI